MNQCSISNIDVVATHPLYDASRRALPAHSQCLLLESAEVPDARRQVWLNIMSPAQVYSGRDSGECPLIVPWLDDISPEAEHSEKKSPSKSQ